RRPAGRGAGLDARNRCGSEGGEGFDRREGADRRKALDGRERLDRGEGLERREGRLLRRGRDGDEQNAPQGDSAGAERPPAVRAQLRHRSMLTEKNGSVNADLAGTVLPGYTRDQT